MRNKTWSLLLTAALIAGVFTALPARSQEAPPEEVPGVVNIEDPFGDANTLGGDQVTPVDGGSQTDIGKVWLTNDETNLNVHFLTEGAPSANSFGFQFVLLAGPEGCLVFDGFFDGTTYLSENLGRVIDNCNKLERTVGTFTFGPGPGGEGGLATITVPRSYSPLFVDGSVISAPIAQTWIFAGGEQLVPSGYRGVRQRIDDTKPGTDYTISSGGPKPDPSATPAPPGKNDPPGKKKGCKKGSPKAKKKGCKKKKKKGCPAFVPGEKGTEAPLVKLTDAATEKAPVAHPVTFEQSVADLTFGATDASYQYVNLQVDSAKAKAGLYALLEFPSRNDYDVNLLHPDGSYAARSRAWNTIIELNDVGPRPLSTTGHGGESTDHSEKLVGITTADCGGWTLELANYLGQGGDFEVQLWLGEVVTEPQAQGEETP